MVSIHLALKAKPSTFVIFKDAAKFMAKLHILKLICDGTLGKGLSYASGLFVANASLAVTNFNDTFAFIPVRRDSHVNRAARDLCVAIISQNMSRHTKIKRPKERRNQTRRMIYRIRNANKTLILFPLGKVSTDLYLILCKDFKKVIFYLHFFFCIG